MWSILAVIIFVAGLLAKNELLVIASSGFAVAGELWAIFNQMRKEHNDLLKILASLSNVKKGENQSET